MGSREFDQERQKLFGLAAEALTQSVYHDIAIGEVDPRFPAIKALHDEVEAIPPEQRRDALQAMAASTNGCNDGTSYAISWLKEAGLALSVFGAPFGLSYLYNHPYYEPCTKGNLSMKVQGNEVSFTDNDTRRFSLMINLGSSR